MIDGLHARSLRSTQATLTWQPTDADGEPADPGVVTVSVAASDGTEVLPAGTATSGTGSDPRTVTLTATQTAQLDRFTATWTAGALVVATTYLDVVGGYYFTLAELRSIEPSTSDTTKDKSEALRRCRGEVEQMIEDVCGVAFVPRFDVDRLQVHANGDVMLRYPQTRVVRWLRYDDGGTPTFVDDATVAAIIPPPNGSLCIGTSYGSYVDVGAEHGYDAPPPDLKRAALTLARAHLNMARSVVPDRATSLQLPDGGLVTLATPGVGTWHSGLPEVDEVLKRYTQKGPTLG